MTNPLNQLPINAELAQEIDAETKRLSAKFGGLVFLIVAHENSKAHIFTECDESSPMLKKIAEDIPRFLVDTALMLRTYEYFETKEGRH